MDCIYSIVVNEGNAVERYKRRRDFGGVGMQSASCLFQALLRSRQKQVTVHFKQYLRSTGIPH